MKKFNKATEKFASNLSESAISTVSKKFKEILQLNDSNENIREIITSLNGTTSYDDPSHWEDNQIASLTVNAEDKKFEIIASKYLSEEEKNYAIAHELGHYILHSDLGKRSLEFSLYGNGILEDEADAFAYNLLMPKEKFKEIYLSVEKSNTATSVYFNVPSYIVDNRAKDLNL